MMDTTLTQFELVELYFCLFFYFDVLLTFFTAIYKKGYLITELSQIRKDYLSFGFFFDMITSFPFEIVIILLNEELSKQLTVDGENVKLNKLVICKLIKIPHLQCEEDEADQTAESEQTLASYLKNAPIHLVLPAVPNFHRHDQAYFNDPNNRKFFIMRPTGWLVCGTEWAS